MKNLCFLFLLIVSFSANAADFCVSGVKGTVTSAFTFKITSHAANEKSVSVIENGKTQIFQSPALNNFTQFNSSGYGACSIVAQGKDESSGAQYKLELKIAPHYQKACMLVGLPTSIEYLTLKIIPKGTTLGDELTAYALSITPCP